MRHGNLQIPGLVHNGFRVIAPDLGGAINGKNDAPQDVQAYNLQKALVKDVAGDHSHNPLSSSRTELHRPGWLCNPPRCSFAKQCAPSYL